MDIMFIHLQHLIHFIVWITRSLILLLHPLHILPFQFLRKQTSTWSLIDRWRIHTLPLSLPHAPTLSLEITSSHRWHRFIAIVGVDAGAMGHASKSLVDGGRLDVGGIGGGADGKTECSAGCEELLGLDVTRQVVAKVVEHFFCGKVLGNGREWKWS